MEPPASFQTAPADPRLHPPSQLLLILLATVAGAMVGTAAVAATAYYLATPIIVGPDFAERFTPPLSDFYLDQPRKNAAFVAGCLAAPVFLLVGCVFWRRFISWVPGRFLPWLLDAGLALTALFFLWSISPVVACANPPYPPVPPSWFYLMLQNAAAVTVPRLVSVGIALFLYVILWRRGISRRYAAAVSGLLLVTWIALLPTNFYAPAEANDESRFSFHFNTVSDALSQACNGHHYLVDFPDLYGGYVEFLAPILALLPRKLGVLLAVFGILRAGGILFLLLTARSVIRRPLFLLATAAALLGEFFLTQYECYYQYSAIRVIFPAAGLFLASRYFRRPQPRTYVAVTLLAVLAPLWNLDTGSVFWLSWAATLAVSGFVRRGVASALRHVMVQVSCLVIAGGLFLLYLRLVSGRWPDPALATVFQKLTVNGGYFCLGMLVPDVWLMILTFYAACLASVAYFYLGKSRAWKTDFTLMLTLLGIGLFDYFLGRSAESNLMWCIYPMILLVGLVLDQAASLVALGRLPRVVWVFLAPFVVASQYWAAFAILGVPTSLSRSSDVVSKWTASSDTPFMSDATFIKSRTTPGEKVYLLSRQSGIDYYLSGTVCPLEIPGSSELFDRRYEDILLGAIQAGKIPKIFLDQDYTEGASVYRPDVIAQLRQDLDQHYVAAGTSPGGQVTLYLPR